MLKNISGEVSIKWEDKVLNMSLSNALIKLAIVAVIAITFAAIFGFVLFGYSLIGFLFLILLSSAGLGASVFYGRSYILGYLFKGQMSPANVASAPAAATPAAPATPATSNDQGQAQA
jgi:hypothetical protein